MALISMILLAVDLYFSAVYQWTLSVIYNIAYTIALLALGYFYLGTRTLIAQHNPVRKFLAVKLVVFMTYWQSLIVTTLPGMTSEEGYKWDDFILCLEMLVFAVVHLYAFSAREYHVKGPVPSSQRRVLSHLVSVLSVRDVVQDAVNNFGARQLPIEGYRGVALLNDQDRSFDLADKFVSPRALHSSADEVELGDPSGPAPLSDDPVPHDGI